MLGSDLAPYLTWLLINTNQKKKQSPVKHQALVSSYTLAKLQGWGVSEFTEPESRLVDVHHSVNLRIAILESVSILGSKTEENLKSLDSQVIGLKIWLLGKVITDPQEWGKCRLDIFSNLSWLLVSCAALDSWSLMEEVSSISLVLD